jgi:serine/threonine protein kinase
MYVWGPSVEVMKFDSLDSAFYYYNNITLRPYTRGIKFRDYFIQNQKYLIEFEEKGVLGSGSFGVVHKVEDKLLDKKSLYAVKIIKTKISEDSLLSEFRISSVVTILDENFVVRIYNAWFENDFEIVNSNTE